MKRSKAINLVFINVMAASILGCSNSPEPEGKHCVDKDGVVIDESHCNPGSHNYRPGMAMWYFGGGLFNHGSRVSGGTYTPLAGRSYVTPSQRNISSGSHANSPSVTRGGFGSSGVSGGS